MAVLGLSSIPVPFVALCLVVAFALRRIYFELTTGARRRRMISENGCKEPYSYPHKGILGKLLGLDVIKELLKTGKEGRMLEASRERNFGKGHHTLRMKIIERHSEHFQLPGAVRCCFMLDCAVLPPSLTN